MSILDTLAAGEQNPGLQYGVSAGIVTNNKDPDGLARVKLKFPWLSDDNETDWVRIAFLAAGARRGSFFLPEVGDEVLVAFEHGDINSPYVIGTLWNAKDRPPETNGDGKNNIRKITSRSGHEIVFDDNAEGKKEKLEIKTNAGHKIVLDDAPGQEKIEIVDKSGSNKILIDTMRKAVNIESGMQLKIKADMVEIAGSTKLVLTSDGIVEIKGSMVKIN
jgi:uncharacterized protein involved in type VI secretion and phage assembly